MYKVLVGERVNTDRRKRNVGKNEAKRVFGTKSYSQYQVQVTVLSAYNILLCENQTEIEKELGTLLFCQGIVEHEKKTGKSEQIYKLHQLTFQHLSGVLKLARGVIKKRDVIYGWATVFEWIQERRQSPEVEFESAVGGVFDGDAKIVEAVEIMSARGFKPGVTVQCSLVHDIKANRFILQVLSKQTVQVWVNDCIYELHTTKVKLIL